MLGLLLLIVSAAGTLYYLTRPARLAGLIAQVIESSANVQASVGAAHLSLNGELRLDDVELTAANQPKGADRLFEARRVLIEPNLGALLDGRLEARSIVLLDPTLDMIEDVEHGRYTFQMLGAGRQGGEARQLPDKLPEVFVHGGRLRFDEVDKDGVHHEGELRLTGTLTQSSQWPDQYAFVLRQQTRSSGSTPTLRGNLDLRHLKVQAVLKDFAIDQPQRNLLPRRLRRWWDRLSPRGSLPVVQVTYDADPDVGLHASILLKHGELTLPYGNFAPRMRGVNGRFVIDQDTIDIQNLVGRVEGIRYAVNGEISGFKPDAPFVLRARTQPFTLKKNSNFLDLLPPRMRDRYDRFRPSGRFQTRATIRRTRRGGKLHYDGTLRLINARIRYWKFPYPIDHLWGEVHFSDKRVRINQLHGRGAAGGKLNISATLTPKADGPLRVKIVAADLALNHALIGAMKPEYRRVLHVLWSRGAYRRLIHKGLVKPPPLSHRTRRTADAADRSTDAAPPSEPKGPPPNHVPRFDLGGRISAVVRIRRAHNPDRDLRVVTTIDTTGATMLLKFWPYPLRSAGGRIVIAPDRLLVRGLRARGLTGGRATVNGWIDLPQDEPNRLPRPPGQTRRNALPIPLSLPGLGQGREVRELVRASLAPTTPTALKSPFPTRTPSSASPALATGVEPHIEIRNLRVPIDDLLRASVPSPQDQWLDRLDVRGGLVGGGRVFKRPDGQVDFALHAHLDHGVAAPIGPEAGLSDLRGAFTLSRSRLELDHLAGRHDHQRLGLSGVINWSDANPRAQLRLRGTDLQLTSHLLDLLPRSHPARRRLDQLMRTYNPAARFDAALDYRSVNRNANGDRGEDFLLTLRPRKLAFDMNQRRLKLNGMSGTAVVRPGAIDLDHLSIPLPHGGVTASGRVHLRGETGPPGALALHLQAHADELDEPVRALLPTSARNAIDALHLRGAFDLNAALVRQTNKGEDTQTRFDGAIRMRDVSADVGVAVGHLRGRLNLTAVHDSGNPRPRIDVRVRADRLRAAGRLIAPLEMHARTSRQGDMLALDHLEGRMYGGTVVGSGLVELNNAERYQLKLTLSEVGLDPMLTPPPPPSPSAAAADLGAVAPHHASSDRNTERRGAEGGATRGAQPSRPSGRLSASLAVGGESGRPASRRGRGVLRVRDARLYDRPLPLAILQTASLNLPTHGSFDRASARYLVNGETLRLNSLRVESPTLAIAGSGEMNLPTHRLDLTMVARNPGAVDLGVLNQAINLFKDQLIAIHVTGSPAQPRATLVPFGGVRSSWNQIFGSVSPRPGPRPGHVVKETHQP